LFRPGNMKKLSPRVGVGEPQTSGENLRKVAGQALPGAEARPGRRGASIVAERAAELLSRGTHPTYVQKSLGHASVQLPLDRYSHWMPSMGRNTAEGIDEALG
jgi:integrase